MTKTLLLALVLLPASASAAVHSVIVRVSKGGAASTYMVRASPGGQKNFRGKSGGRDMTVDAILSPAKDGFGFQYQLEVSKPGGEFFQAQAAVQLRPGDQVRVANCGGWKVDLFADSDAVAEPPAWDPNGPNYRVAAFGTKTLCWALESPEGQVVMKVGHAYGLRATVHRPEESSVRLEYAVKEGALDASGEQSLALGRKVPAEGGRVQLLVEGPAVAARSAELPDAARPRQESGDAANIHDGAPALLR